MGFSGDASLTRRSLLQMADGAGLAAMGGPAALGLVASKAAQLAVIVDQTGGGTWAWNRSFRAAFAHRYRQAPDVFAAQGYDGIYAVATALRRSSSISNRKVLRTALANLKDVPSVLSASGHLSFTPGRQDNLTPTVQIVRQGRCVPFP